MKAIFKLQAESLQVSTTALASELDRSAASVTNMVKGLAEQGLLVHEPYHGVRLTSRGESAALRIIRRHRVIETYLIERLGYTWDGVHAEADRLEHAASDDLIDRMARALGDPDEDPHGAPIPSSDGVIVSRDLVALTELPEGEEAVVREVSDEDSDRLRELAAAGFLLGTTVVLIDRSPAGDVAVRIAGGVQRLDAMTAGLIWLEQPDTKRADEKDDSDKG
ncbi:MAG: metal-dependent transcriptional regulator [Gemmatimonadetes bacterium]|nr:metal-dependent transcriptional regulator [Gemmatimonadota bacterium]